MRALRWLWLWGCIAAGGLAGASGCAEGVTIEVMCAHLCTCVEPSPFAQADCRSECEADFGMFPNLPQECVACFAGAECSELDENLCADECGFGP
jgi:hypothetical protein